MASHGSLGGTAPAEHRFREVERDLVHPPGGVRHALDPGPVLTHADQRVLREFFRAVDVTDIQGEQADDPRQFALADGCELSVNRHGASSVWVQQLNRTYRTIGLPGHEIHFSLGPAKSSVFGGAVMRGGSATELCEMNRHSARCIASQNDDRAVTPGLTCMAAMRHGRRCTNQMPKETMASAIHCSPDKSSPRTRTSPEPDERRLRDITGTEPCGNASGRAGGPCKRFHAAALVVPTVE